TPASAPAPAATPAASPTPASAPAPAASPAAPPGLGGRFAVEFARSSGQGFFARVPLPRRRCLRGARGVGYGFANARGRWGRLTRKLGIQFAGLEVRPR